MAHQQDLRSQDFPAQDLLPSFGQPDLDQMAFWAGYEPDLTAASAETIENLAALRKAFEDWYASLGADASTFVDLFAENVDFWSIAQSGPSNALGFTGTRTKRAEIAGFFQQIHRSWRMERHVIMLITFAGEHVQTLHQSKWTARVSGKSVETLIFCYFQFRGGKIIRYREMFDSAGALASLHPG